MTHPSAAANPNTTKEKPLLQQLSRGRSAQLQKAINDPRLFSAEAIALRLDAIRSKLGHRPYILGVSGCERSVGTSAIASNIAITSARMNMGQVLLVDCDIPMTPRRRKAGPGLVDLIHGDVTVEEVVTNGVIDGLNYLAGGRFDARPLSPELTEGTFKALRSDFDLVILDLPPVRNASRSLLFNRVVDGLALVIDAKKTRIRSAETAMQILRENEVEVIGTILNRTRPTLPRWMDRWA